MAQVNGVFEDTLQKNVTDSKVLMVGAGGIGCELLKNLVLSGSKTIGFCFDPVKFFFLQDSKTSPSSIWTLSM